MEDVIGLFGIEGRVISQETVGSGHINRTWRVCLENGKRYILQRINHEVFRDVDALMRNISSVTAFLARKDPDPRHVLHLIPTLTGNSYARCAGGCFRLYENIEHSVCLMQASGEEVLRKTGAAFGRFQRDLHDFPADTLAETIPRFHDTPDRFRKFRASLAADPRHRAASVQGEIDFLLSREKDMSVMTDMRAAGQLPLRVTHNDTKLSNVLFDETTLEPLCVIDLDTIMPGLIGNDFGDAIRFGASTALEDETDLSKVHFSLSLYSAFAEGFLGMFGPSMTREEIDTLPWGARLMTLECGMRFLTDYLEGDVYFHIDRERHNLDRARTQFKLVAEMEQNFDAMRQVIRRVL